MAKRKKTQKLYIWDGVLTDWTSGMIVVLASSDEEAYEVLCRDFQYQKDRNQIGPDLEFEGEKPEITELDGNQGPCSWSVYGGG